MIKFFDHSKLKKNSDKNFLNKFFDVLNRIKRKTLHFLIINDYLIYLKQSKEISDLILQYIDDEDNLNENLTKIIDYIKQLDEERNVEIIRSTLKVITALSKNHNRKNGLISKIEKIIVSIKTIIITNLTNIEIFKIFEHDPRTLFTLFEHGIITLDYTLYPIVFKSFYSPHKKLRHFLYPVFKKKICKKKVDKIESELKEKYKIEDFKSFEENCRKGENELTICSLIRNDSIDDFVVYVTKTNISLSNQIKQSIFETNEFLFDKTPTLIEYAAFFGSIQIFRFLLLNNVELNEDLLLYAIHGKNPEIIHILESYKIIPENENYHKLLFESIKCHHNEITNYILNNYIADDNIFKKYNDDTIILEKYYYNNVIAYAIEYSNFDYYPKDFKNKFILFYCCQFNNLYLAKLLQKEGALDLNIKLIPDIVSRNNSFSPCQLASQYKNYKIFDFLIQQPNISFYKGYFKDCANLKRITISEHCQIINDSLFEGCTSLTTIEIPSSVTFIGKKAFASCSKLKKITIPSSVFRIDDYAFNNCKSLEQIELSNGLKEIGAFAFSNCSSLKKIIIPKSVIHIGFNAFKNYSSLKEIIILSKIVKIQFNAFDQCESLEKVIMPTSIFQLFYDYFLRRNILLINDSVENIISKYIKK